MALDRENLLQLMKVTVGANPASNYAWNGENFTYGALNNTLRDELNALVGTEELWEDNSKTFFRLISETVNEVLPPRLIERYGQFAEIRQYGQGFRLSWMVWTS